MDGRSAFGVPPEADCKRPLNFLREHLCVLHSVTVQLLYIPVPYHASWLTSLDLACTLRPFVPLGPPLCPGKMLARPRKEDHDGRAEPPDAPPGSVPALPTYQEPRARTRTRSSVSEADLGGDLSGAEDEAAMATCRVKCLLAKQPRVSASS